MLRHNVSGVRNSHQGGVSRQLRDFGSVEDIRHAASGNEQVRNSLAAPDINRINTQNSNPVVNNLTSPSPAPHINTIPVAPSEKRFADIRVKMGDKKTPNKFEDELSIPSDIEPDAWDELPKYQYLKHQEELRQQKQRQKEKKDLIKITLDQQIKQQRQMQEEKLAKIKDMDNQILKKAREEIEQEKQKQALLKEKTMKQKEQREKMIIDAKRRKENEFRTQREKELVEVAQLKNDLLNEKKQKVEKRQAEKEQAWKVIRENEAEKEKRAIEKQKEKDKQNRIIEEYNKMIDAQEKKRAEEWAAREARIKNAMDKMADTVIKKSNQAEKEAELRAVQYANEMDKKAEMRERAKKEE